jgi:hypothetical protein
VQRIIKLRYYKKIALLLILFGIAAFILGCGSSNKYSKTESQDCQIKQYAYPEGKKMIISPPQSEYQCIVSSIESYIKDMGIQIISVPCVKQESFVKHLIQNDLSITPEENTALQSSLILIVSVDVTDGPGGFWNPMNGQIASKLKRTDVSMSLYNPECKSFVWKGKLSKQKILKCTDDALIKMVKQIVTSIKKGR